MRIHIINPSDISFGTAVITPRWLYVLAAATPAQYGTPVIVDETLEPFDPDSVTTGDVVGIGIHTANALRGYQLGRLARERASGSRLLAPGFTTDILLEGSVLSPGVLYNRSSVVLALRALVAPAFRACELISCGFRLQAEDAARRSHFGPASPRPDAR